MEEGVKETNNSDTEELVEDVKILIETCESLIKLYPMNSYNRESVIRIQDLWYKLRQAISNDPSKKFYVPKLDAYILTSFRGV